MRGLILLFASVPTPGGVYYYVFHLWAASLRIYLFSISDLYLFSFRQA